MFACISGVAIARAASPLATVTSERTNHFADRVHSHSTTLHTVSVARVSRILFWSAYKIQCNCIQLAAQIPAHVIRYSSAGSRTR